MGVFCNFFGQLDAAWLYSQISHMDRSLRFMFAGVFRDLAGADEKVPGIDDEIIAGIHHVLVGSGDAWYFCLSNHVIGQAIPISK